jgi:hypothetical protein
MTREHPLSYGLFLGPEIVVEGLGREEARSVHPKSLVAKCLCQKHNSEVSELDQAAIDVANALRRLSTVRRAFEASGEKIGPSLRLEVSGRLLERWALKCAAGMAHMMRRSIDGWQPPTELARMAFGEQPIPEGCGLALVGVEGSCLEEGERWHVGFGNRPGEREPSGVFLRLLGWPFLVTWSSPPRSWAGASIEGVLIDGENLLGKPSITIKSGPRLSLAFSWRENWKPRKGLIALRRRYGAPTR